MEMDEAGGTDNKRGVKRQASDSNLTDLDRFEKRLRALSIRNDEKRAEKNSHPQFHKRVPSKPGVLSTGFKRTAPTPTPIPNTTVNDGMDVDPTRDRIYIADLDAELASSEDEDAEKLIFLPDIEKKFSRLPHQVYESSNYRGDSGPQELVLYSDPKSLSVDEGHDSVRKAVVEARQRAREKAAVESQARQEDMERSYGVAGMGRGDVNGDGGVETAHGYGDVGYMSPLRFDQEDDPDAMDLG